MYTEYWQLETQPFGPTSDRRFYYPTESHQGAMLKLRYVVESGSAAAVLTGRSGTGKTLLIQVLCEQLPEKISPVVQVVFPQMSGRDLWSTWRNNSAHRLPIRPATRWKKVSAGSN